MEDLTIWPFCLQAHIVHIRNQHRGASAIWAEVIGSRGYFMAQEFILLILVGAFACSAYLDHLIMHDTVCQPHHFGQQISYMHYILAYIIYGNFILASACMVSYGALSCIALHTAILNMVRFVSCHCLSPSMQRLPYVHNSNLAPLHLFRVFYLILFEFCISTYIGVLKLGYHRDQNACMTMAE